MAKESVEELQGGQLDYFNGAGGTSRQFFRFVPKGEPSVILIGLHGLTSHAGWLAPIARELTDSGIETWTVDRIGTATSSGRPYRRGDIDGWETWIEDVRCIVERAERCYPGRPIVLWGYSLGGVIAAAYLIEDRSSTPVDHTVVMAPGWATVTPSQKKTESLLRISELAPDLRIKLPVSRDLARAHTLSIMDADNAVTRWVTMRYLREIHEMQTHSNLGLREIDLPVTIMLAQCDALIDNDRVIELAQDLQNQRVVPVKNLGHFLVVEDPQRVARMLRDVILSK